MIDRQHFRSSLGASVYHAVSDDWPTRAMCGRVQGRGCYFPNLIFGDPEKPPQVFCQACRRKVEKLLTGFSTAKNRSRKEVR